uniref:ribose-phosphate diphosphokinase n=1 Tax=Peronospora matthiolae TaxID=2874970 RepID=A0AAV1U6D1_9STRA
MAMHDKTARWQRVCRFRLLMWPGSWKLVGVDRVIAVDLHCGQIQGFFGPHVPVDNLDGGLVGVSYFGQPRRIKAGEIDRMDLVGQVKGSDCIIVDDMIDTAGTLCKAAQHLVDHGASNAAFAPHGLFNGAASDRIKASALKEVVVVNTTPLPKSCEGNEKIVQLDIAPLLAQAIQNIHGKKSVSQLFH